ncbi:hypothetical protein ACFO9E_18320 [Streptomyces maoxianensis]|uniref:Uncharacterized protein n=1 Tax=Streptomyces maoxianensis TaxID=1459942 RepID=A0ABV9G9G9_9ACTN
MQMDVDGWVLPALAAIAGVVVIFVALTQAGIKMLEALGRLWKAWKEFRSEE